MSSEPSAARPVVAPISPRINRLTRVELMYLRAECPEWPGHFGGLAVLEGGALLDADGRLRLGEIRRRLDRRLAQVPRLRRRVHEPGLVRGRPFWLDDDQFAIGNHVHETAVPGGDAALLDAAASVFGTVLDRGRPLWELWFLTGLEDERVGMLLKLHHAVADGQAAVRVMEALFDLDPDAPDPVAGRWDPEAPPRARALFADNLAGVVRALGRGVRMLAHPVRIGRGVRVLFQVVRKSMGVEGAARTSLNQPVGIGRRVRFLSLDLAQIKQVAHARGGKLNDVVLDVWAGGLRGLLVSRGESVEHLEPTTGLPVSMRSATDGAIDNQVGTIVLPLPVWEEDAMRRLDLIVGITSSAKARMRPAAIMGAVVGLAATPIGRYLMLHQRATNVLVTNVVGPPDPVHVLGARIVDICPITDLTGNLGLTLCAFSYAGTVFLAVTADAASFSDIDVLIDGMARDWESLWERMSLPSVSS